VRPVRAAARGTEHDHELAVSDAEVDSLEGGDNDVSQPQGIELESSSIASG